MARLRGGRHYPRFVGEFQAWFRTDTAKPGSKPSLQARLVAVTLAGQAGPAFGATQTARSVP